MTFSGEGIFPSLFYAPTELSRPVPVTENEAGKVTLIISEDEMPAAGRLPSYREPVLPYSAKAPPDYSGKGFCLIKRNFYRLKDTDFSQKFHRFQFIVTASTGERPCFPMP